MIKPPAIKVRFKTSHPALFTCYWGWCNFDESNPFAPINAEICANRDRFVADFGIVSRYRKTGWLDRIFLWGFSRYQLWMTRQDIDHPEYYRAADGRIVVIVSNYDKSPPPPVLAMEEYIPIYSHRTRTFVRTFANGKEIRRFWQQVRDQFPWNLGLAHGFFPNTVPPKRRTRVTRVIPEPLSEG